MIARLLETAMLVVTWPFIVLYVWAKILVMVTLTVAAKVLGVWVK